MRDLADVLPCGIVTFDDGGIIASANETLAAWLGYSPEELTGVSLESILTTPSRIFYQTHFFPLIKLHSKADEGMWLPYLIGKNYEEMKSKGLD